MESIRLLLDDCRESPPEPAAGPAGNVTYVTIAVLLHRPKLASGLQKVKEIVTFPGFFGNDVDLILGHVTLMRSQLIYSCAPACDDVA